MSDSPLQSNESNNQRLLALLPFYLNGTLLKEEHVLVQTKLAESEELQQALEFWKGIRSATLELGGYEKQHLSPGLLLDYVEKKLRAEEMPFVQEHIAACSACQNDAQIVRETYPREDSAAPGKMTETGFTKPRFSLSTMFRPRYYIPLVSAIVLVVVFFANPFKSPPKSEISLTVYYFDRNRSPGSAYFMPSFTIGSLVNDVTLRMIIPSSGIPSTTYLLTLVPPTGNKTTFPEPLVVNAANEDVSETLITLPVTYFQAIGKYELIVTEKPAASVDVMPREYHLNFNRK